MIEHDQIAPALVAALAELTNVAKAHEGGGGGKTYTYANIADLIAETRPVLAGHGIVALTAIHDHGNGLACTVTLLHTSGQRLDFGPAPFPHGKDAQATGSWITYMRRYCLLAALGMGAEDDDGEKAKAATRQPQPQTYTSAAAKKSLIERLAKSMERDVAEADAAKLWREQIGDSRSITSAEWDALCEAADSLAMAYIEGPQF